LAPQSLTPKEQKDFLRAVERCKRPRDRALATLILNTGIRISECRDLDIADVSLSERKRIIKIRNGKGGFSRQNPLNAACRESLQLWLRERQARYPNTTDESFFYPTEALECP